MASKRSLPSGRELWWPIVAMSLPAVVVLVALVALDRLDASYGLVAAMAVIIAMILLVRSYHSDIVAIARYVEELAVRNNAVPPSLNHASPFAPILAGMRGLRRLLDSARRLAAARGNESGLDRLPDPVLLIDSDRRVVRANGAAEELLGPNPAGRDLATVLRNPAVLQAVDAVLNGEAQANVEFSFPVPVERHFSARIASVAGPDGEGPAVIVALYDLTAIKRAEQMRSDFVANASHELRTPLSVLSGCIDTLRGSARDDPDAQSEFLGLMQGHAERMTRLVEDLLALSRIELNEHTLPGENTDVGQLAAGVAESLAFTAKSRNIEITLDIAADLPTIAGDRDELSQALQNLIDNAIKYAVPDTTILVTARLARDGIPHSLAGVQQCIALAVGDQGEGIAPEHLPRLTERFYRVDTARSRELGGTGLGLAIVKHVVSRHRGTLTIESDTGKGSVFTVWLPITTPDGEYGAPEAPAQSA